MDAAREVGRGERDALAEVLRDAAVVLARNLRTKIRVAIERKEQFVKAGRAKTFAIAAAQRRAVTMQWNRHCPGRTLFFAEVAVAIDAEAAGRFQKAVKQRCLLFEITGVLL